MNHASAAGVLLVRNKRVPLFKLPSRSSQCPCCSVTLSPVMLVAEQLIFQTHFSPSPKRPSVNEEKPAGGRKENKRERRKKIASGVDLYTDWLFFSRSKLVLPNFVELSVCATTLASFFSLFVTLYIFIYLPIIHLSIICLSSTYLRS